MGWLGRPIRKGQYHTASALWGRNSSPPNGHCQTAIALVGNCRPHVGPPIEPHVSRHNVGAGCRLPLNPSIIRDVQAVSGFLMMQRDSSFLDGSTRVEFPDGGNRASFTGLEKIPSQLRGPHLTPTLPHPPSIPYEVMRGGFERSFR